MALRTLLALGALAALAACGQPNSASSTSASTTSASTTMAAATPDSAFLAKAAMFEHFELQAADLAAHQAQAQSVKDYAAEETTGHTAALQQLTSLAQAHGMAAPNDDLDDNYNAYLDMLRRANGASFDSVYESQQALAYINAAGIYDSYTHAAADSPLKQWAATRLPQLQQGVTTARQLAAAH